MCIIATLNVIFSFEYFHLGTQFLKIYNEQWNDAYKVLFILVKDDAKTVELLADVVQVCYCLQSVIHTCQRRCQDSKASR